MLFAPWTSTNSQSRLEVYKFVCWANSGRCAWLVLGTSWDCWWGLVPCLAELQLASTRVTHWRLWTTCRQPNIPDIQPKMPNVSKCIQMYQSHPIPCLRPKMFSKRYLSCPESLGASWFMVFQALRPTIFPSVPRLLTRVHDRCHKHGSPRAVLCKCHEDPWSVSKCSKMLQDASSSQGMNCAWTRWTCATLQTDTSRKSAFSLRWICMNVWRLRLARKLYKVRTVRCDKPRSHSKSFEASTLLHR